MRCFKSGVLCVCRSVHYGQEFVWFIGSLLYSASEPVCAVLHGPYSRIGLKDEVMACCFMKMVAVRRQEENIKERHNF